MKAGKFDRRITIRRQGEPTDNGIEEVPGAWGDYATRWASWKPANGREVFENLGRAAKSGGTFWLRHDSDTSAILTTDRVLWGSRNFEIVAIQEMGRNEGIELIVVDEG